MNNNNILYYNYPSNYQDYNSQPNNNYYNNQKYINEAQYQNNIDIDNYKALAEEKIRKEKEKYEKRLKKS